MTEFDYLRLRVDVLEEMLNDIVNYNVAKNGDYNSCLPSESNFWNQQLAPKLNNAIRALDDAFNEVKESE